MEFLQRELFSASFWQELIPETQDEIYFTMIAGVLLTMFFFIALMKWKRPRASVFPLIVATPIFFILFGNVVQPEFDYGRFIVMFLLVVLVQACFAIKVLRTPKHMYARPSDYKHLDF